MMMGGGGLMPTKTHEYLEHDYQKEMFLCMVFKVISDKLIFFLYVNHIWLKERMKQAAEALLLRSVLGYD